MPCRSMVFCPENRHLADKHTTGYNMFTMNCRHFVQDVYALMTNKDMIKLTSRIEA